MVTPHPFASSQSTAQGWGWDGGGVHHCRAGAAWQGRHCRVFAAPCDVSVYVWQGVVRAILVSAPDSGLLCPCLQGPVLPQRHPLSHRASLSTPCSQVVCSALLRPHLCALCGNNKKPKQKKKKKRAMKKAFSLSPRRARCEQAHQPCRQQAAHLALPLQHTGHALQWRRPSEGFFSAPFDLLSPPAHPALPGGSSEIPAEGIR